jgi:endonuclease-3 related protein
MLTKIYNILLKTYSHQKWWPVTSKNKQFEIILGAILTQNTSWKNVEKAIANLKKENTINPDKILKLNKSKLAKLIKSSGYYNQKAGRLKLISKFYLENKNPTREQLLEVKGIGNETADSILLYAYNKPFFVVDLYTKRIFSRLGLIKTDNYKEIQELFMKSLPKNPKLFNEYHALIVKLAKEHCRKKPVCKSCPLVKLCKKFI